LKFSVMDHYLCIFTFSVVAVVISITESQSQDSNVFKPLTTVEIKSSTLVDPMRDEEGNIYGSWLKIC